MVSYAEKIALRPGDARPRVLASLGPFALVVFASCLAGQTPTVTIKTGAGEVSVKVELATTSEQRTRGLMWRNELGRDAGMLFAFPDERPRSFWMKNTPIALDIIFIDANKRIVSISADAKPYSTERIPSKDPSIFVLEVNAGFCERHGIEPGQAVDLPQLAGPVGP